MLPFTPQSLLTLLNLKVDLKDREVIKRIDKDKFISFCKKHGFVINSRPLVKDFNNEDLKIPSKVIEIFTHDSDNFKEIWYCDKSDEINYPRLMFDNFNVLEKLTNIPQLLILLEVISNEVVENKQEILAK